MRKYVHPDRTVIELGGGIGMISCVANRQLNAPVNHFVVEANTALTDKIEATNHLSITNSKLCMPFRFSGFKIETILFVVNMMSIKKRFWSQS